MMDSKELSDKMYQLVEDLYPIHRSNTGDGVRETFAKLSELIPLRVIEIPSGTKVYDWVVPQEWTIRDAYIKDQSGNRIVDYADSNLHVLNGSMPIQGVMDWQELEPHLHSIPEMPEAVPYRTAYFRDEWGFCVSEVTRNEMAVARGPFEVCIDSNYFQGSLTYAECEIVGTSDETVLIYCHTCHPSLANDNLSGIVVSTFLAKQLTTAEPRLTYRFVFAPATIGAISWLAQNETTVVPKIKHGLILSLLGSEANFTYKSSRQSNSTIDSIATQLANDVGGKTIDFTPFGYDERQFCSPGFDLPIGCLMRSQHAAFPEYHTSLDNLNFISGERLVESLELCERIIHSLEEESESQFTNNKPSTYESHPEYPLRVDPRCEPMLGKHKLYDAYGHQTDNKQLQNAVLWALNLSDGKNSLEEIAVRSGLPTKDIHTAVEILKENQLLIK